jgi:prolyl-tRNA editing enzyme YbaK/EbsC (Cys-tRNA(Pro) deacylase)
MGDEPCRVDRWPEAVERVAAFLREAGAEARIEEFSEGTPTAQHAAEAAGCDLAQIVKSLVFVCDGRPVLALVPGDRRADRAKIAEAAGASKARIADADGVRRITGFEPGAVCPFPLAEPAEILVEHTLLSHAVVWIGAGSTSHMAALPPPELLRLTRARAVDIADEG